MRLYLPLAAAVLLFSTGTALASTPDYDASSDSSSGFSWGSVSGLLAAGGAAAAVGGLAALFANHSSGAHVQVTAASPVSAPEISSTGSTSGLILVLGGALVANGRRRKLTLSRG